MKVSRCSCDFEIIHDNLNNQWLLADLSNDKYQFYHKIKEDKPTKSIKKLNLFPTLTLIFIMIFITSIFFKIQPMNDKIFATYYSSENIIDVTRSNTANLAIEKFNEKKYQEASTLFLEIIKKDTTNITIQFYNGICYIELDKLDDAIKTFQYIIDFKDTLYVEHAEWYLALCYLKKNELNLAKKQFTLIAKDSDNFHQKNAIKILKQLQ